MTDLLIKQVLRKPHIVGRMIKYSIELTKFDLYYEPGILADFVAKLTSLSNMTEKEGLKWTYQSTMRLI